MARTKPKVEIVKGYVFKRGKLKGKKVKAYKRKVRKKPKRIFVSPKPVKLYPILDEYNQFHGYSSKPPKPKKRKAQ